VGLQVVQFCNSAHTAEAPGAIRLTPREQARQNLAARAGSSPAAAPVSPEALRTALRQRFRSASRRLRLEPETVLEQFDRWRYTDGNVSEMDSWPEEFVEAHCRVLEDEGRFGVGC